MKSFWGSSGEEKLDRALKVVPRMPQCIDCLLLREAHLADDRDVLRVAEVGRCVRNATTGTPTYDRPGALKKAYRVGYVSAETEKVK